MGEFAEMTFTWDYDEGYPLDLEGDPLHYHSKHSFLEIKVKSKKCMLVTFPNFGELWIPYKIIKEFRLSEKTMYLHTNTLHKIIKNKREA